MNAAEKVKQYDRDAHIVGNIVHLEHFNVGVDDQRLATLFYITGIGGTRDPYLFTRLDNMWVNFGRTQCHLPSRGSTPEVLRGTIGFVVPSLEDLKKRFEHAGREMKRVVPERETKFSWREKDGGIEATRLLPSSAIPSSGSFTSTSTCRRARPTASPGSTRKSSRPLRKRKAGAPG